MPKLRIKTKESEFLMENRIRMAWEKDMTCQTEPALSADISKTALNSWRPIHNTYKKSILQQSIACKHIGIIAYLASGFLTTFPALQKPPVKWAKGRL